MARSRLRPSRHRRTRLALEFGLLYVVLPGWLWVDRLAFAHRIVPTLVLVAAGCLLLLLRDPDFDRRRLWNADGLAAGLVGMLRLLLPTAAALTLLTWWLEPELFLRLPRREPLLWLAVLVLYPVLSVYPQELIFRTFLFHRYRLLFTTPAARVAASGAAFALAHLFFANPVAPALSLLGGVLFARTYARSGSTLQAGIEHGLYGDLLFTIGLGWYFYGGAVG